MCLPLQEPSVLDVDEEVLVEEEAEALPSRSAEREWNGMCRGD